MTPRVTSMITALVVFVMTALAPARSGAVRPQAGAEPARTVVKGIYLNPFTAGHPDRLQPILDLLERTELNSVVVDVKDDHGYMTFPVADPTAVPAGTVRAQIADMAHLIDELRSRRIYSIARVVSFKDGVVTRFHPEWAAVHVDGGLWRDSAGMTWLDPYNAQSWSYLVSIARAAARAGFDEIQFDYVRFPSDGDLDTIQYPAKDQRSRRQVIAEFLAYARRELQPLDVRVSADVFGLVTSFPDDMGVGQRLEEIGATVDYVSPMLYPSHYTPGNLGLANPNAMPYDTVYRSLQDAKGRLVTAGLAETAMIRPWLQDFSMGHAYGPDEVRSQIRATYDAGYSEWMLWNAASQYTEPALTPETESPPSDLLLPDEVGPEVTIGLNGRLLAMPSGDAQPFVVRSTGRTLVPLRFVSEALGATVQWNEAARTATVVWNGKTVKVIVGHRKARVAGDSAALDQPAMLWQDRTMVPLRFLAEAFGAGVHWDGSTNRVELSLP